MLGKIQYTPLFFAFILLTNICNAQVLRLTYDATKGTSNLQDAASVYMHSGAGTAAPDSDSWDIAVGNWGMDDGIGQMTNVGGNFWEIELDLQEYYGLGASDVIYYIGMVFRNAAGNATGKDYANENIYVRGINTGSPEAVQDDGTAFDGLSVELFATGIEELIPQTGANEPPRISKPVCGAFKRCL